MFPTKIEIPSEAIEPTFAKILGVLGMRVEEARKGEDKFGVEDACRRLWSGLKGLDAVTSALQTTHHCTMVLQNEYRLTSQYIFAVTGLNPIIEKW